MYQLKILFLSYEFCDASLKQKILGEVMSSFTQAFTILTWFMLIELKRKYASSVLCSYWLNLWLIFQVDILDGGCFIKLVYQISQAYFSNSDLFSLDLVSESKITIAQAQSL